ncbi:hypothetical protein JW868_03365 [Candidatus Woesearchaeota archaeon]|nr:hypothetical protein [Candidatus Woesearchaeota archaeon]
MVFCTKCGHSNKEGTKFCVKCGNKLKTVQKDYIKKEKPTDREVKKFSQYIPYIIITVLVIAIGILAYEVWYYNMNYNDYYNRFHYETSERARYTQLYEQEQAAKNAEINLRRQKEQELNTAQNKISTQSQEISSLRSSLRNEQQTRQSLQYELSETETELGQQSQQVETVKREIQDITYTINNLETFVKDSSTVSSDRLSKIHDLCGDPITQTGSSCIINANKMGADMKGCIGFTWVDDETTSNFADGQRIFDPDTFWLSKEGDCDDFGMFMAAWLRAEYDRASSFCNQVYIQVRPSSLMSEGLSLTCPCQIYAVGGCYQGGGGSCHMETGISGMINIYGPNAVNYIYVVEPQSGSYDGSAPSNFDGGVNWIFTRDDFIVLNYNQVTNSIKSTSQKIKQINIS